MIGNDIAAGFTTPAANEATHNIMLGRKAANNSGNPSYGILMGYEAFDGVTSSFSWDKQQIIAIGLIGEIIIFTHAKDLKEYKIDKIIN